MYHLVQKKERLKAFAEAYRVPKPRGLLFAAGISRFTSALDGSLRLFIQDPGFMKIVQQDLKAGQHRNPTNKPEYFATAFFHHSDELETEIKQAGFRSVRVHAVTGFAWLLPKFGKIWRTPKLKQRLIEILDQTELEPSMLGLSDHLLAFGKK